jgi:hypothetical protein
VVIQLWGDQNENANSFLDINFKVIHLKIYIYIYSILLREIFVFLGE